MFLSELSDLVRQGYVIRLTGTSTDWHCSLRSIQRAVSATGETPEEALSKAIEQMEYSSGISEIVSK